MILEEYMKKILQFFVLLAVFCRAATADESILQLTKGKQKPTTIIPDSIPDFALGVQ